ncbi:hypothetical protein FB45DRAFT_918623 [Roridomyces roridus]|uniref:Uncharacterized protein n=1 Tax=Roridomyces roridus TaxID=1738132 RepID=A0AAD7BRB2_9AGAR|nr:hypothetical protein FB45DRAFT_918623 [Roridomyces roridus]
MSKQVDDPRDASLETRYTKAPTWVGQDFEGLNTSAMFLSGLIMVTRNRYLAWPSLILGISSMINMHPLRAREGSTGSFSSLILSIGALIASYLPMLMVQNVSSATTTPLAP